MNSCQILAKYLPNTCQKSNFYQYYPILASTRHTRDHRTGSPLFLFFRKSRVLYCVYGRLGKFYYIGNFCDFVAVVCFCRFIKIACIAVLLSPFQSCSVLFRQSAAFWACFFSVVFSFWIFLTNEIIYINFLAKFYKWNFSILAGTSDCKKWVCQTRNCLSFMLCYNFSLK